MKTKKITIPKEIFEKTFLKDSYFKDGGTKDRKELHKALTGEYMFENQDEEAVNAEIEKNEYLFDSQGIRKAEGNTHENGGIDVSLEEGTRIISDHLKPSAKEVKRINDLYDLGAKTSDTYAKVLDKFGRKSGLDKINKELEEYISKLDKQQKDTEDETTLGLNTEYLTGEINEEFKEKAPLEKERETVFNSLFEMQEASKTEEKNKKNFQTGGTMTYNGDPIIEMGKRYNISPERAKELISSFQKGGQVLPRYQDAGTARGNTYSPTNPNNPLFFGKTSFDSSQRISNIYEDPSKFVKQGEVGSGYFGDVVTYNSPEVQNEIRRLHPEIYNKFFKGKEIKPKEVKEFQNAIKNKYEKVLMDAEKLYGKDSEQFNSLKTQVGKDTFLNDDSVRGLEGKFGNFTSTRPNYTFDVLPEDILAEVKNSGIDTASELKEVFPEYYKKYVEPKGLESDFWLGKAPNEPNPEVVSTYAPIEPLPAVEQTPTEKITQPNRSGMLLTPDQTPLSPGSQMAHLKPQRRFERIDPVYISPERQLSEIGIQQQQAYNNISMLPDQQKAATLASIGASTSDATSKIIGDVNRYNAQAQEGANRTNAQIAQSEENAAWQDALNYERNTYLAKDKTDQDWRSYYNRLAENQMNDWKTVEILNRGNAMNPEVQFTGQGYEVAKPTFDNNAAINRMINSADTPVQNLTPKKTTTKKASAKNGGRFKK